METICWVQTPKCRDCKPDSRQKKRLPCLGCSREPAKPYEIPQPKNGKLRKSRQARRDAEILALRAQGLSITAISHRFNIPRSTAYNAVRREKAAKQTKRN